MKVQKTFSTTKGKSQSDKIIKYYCFVLLSFGPLTGDSKAIIEDHSISLLHTLCSHRYSCSKKEEFDGSKENEDYLVVMP